MVWVLMLALIFCREVFIGLTKHHDFLTRKQSGSGKIKRKGEGKKCHQSNRQNNQTWPYLVHVLIDLLLQLVGLLLVLQFDRYKCFLHLRFWFVLAFLLCCFCTPLLCT